MNPGVWFAWPSCAAPAWCWSSIPAYAPAYCTKQLCQFRDDWSEARARGVEIFGVTPQSARKHGEFRRKYGFPFRLLADEGQKEGALYRTTA
jgi:peroxiredoxin Q/BCP